MSSKKSTKTDTIYLNTNQRIDQLPGYMFPPNSIIEKRYTGIGATQSEIKAPRNSIIVFPSKSIALNKSFSNEGTFYVGSLPDNKKVGRESIRNYYNSPAIKFKKFLVVANSLPRLFDALRESGVYENFFLMFDEIDKFQGESTFRTELESCLDYFLHKNCRGCLVSATIGGFSNERLNRLHRIVFERKGFVKPSVKYYCIDPLEHVIKFLYQEIQNAPQDKFLIAHKSLKTIQRIINGLDLITRRNTKILCGESNSEALKPYYGRLDHDLLPGRINFMTAAYFSGVDIEEDFHLIVISDTSTSFSLLTLSEIRQIVGRCRREIKSINIIIPEARINIPIDKLSTLKATAQELLSKASPHQSALKMLKLDEDSLSKNKRAQTLLTYNNVLLLRLNRNNILKVSTFTIDQYCNRNRELRLLYSERRSPIKCLSEFYDVKVGSNTFSGLDFTHAYRKSFLTTIITIPDMKEDNAITKNEKKIYARYRLCQLLMDHVNIDWVIDDNYWSRVSFKKEYIVRYMGKFPVMDPLWEYLEGSIKIGEFYTDRDIRKQFTAALKNYTDEIIPISESDYISVLGGFFDFTKTSSKRQNGFKINSMKKGHSRINILQPTQVEINDYKKYWESC